MFKISQVDIEFQKQIDKQKVDLNKTFKKSFSDQEKILKIFVDSVRHCDFNKYKDDKVIWNVAGYINLISLDLKHFARDLAFADDEWGKRIYARMLGMIIYESVDDLLEMLGKDFRLILKKLSKADEFTKELNLLSKQLNEFKTNNFYRLKEIRNVATAHRDMDILEQQRIITSIGWTEFVEIGSSFDKILNDLGKFTQQVINVSLVEFKK